MNVNVKRTSPMPAEDLNELYLREDKSYCDYVDNPNNLKEQVSLKAVPRDCSGHVNLGKLITLKEDAPVRQRKRVQK